jgi:hypothetical protein
MASMILIVHKRFIHKVELTKHYYHIFNKTIFLICRTWNIIVEVSLYTFYETHEHMK